MLHPLMVVKYCLSAWGIHFLKPRNEKNEISIFYTYTTIKIIITKKVFGRQKEYRLLNPSKARGKKRTESLRWTCQHYQMCSMFFAQSPWQPLQYTPPCTMRTCSSHLPKGSFSNTLLEQLPWSCPTQLWLHQQRSPNYKALMGIPFQGCFIHGKIFDRMKSLL